MGEGTYRRDYGSGHGYWLDGHRVPGVTTMAKGIPSDFSKWSADRAAAYAVDHWDEIAGLPPSERLKVIAKAPWAERDRKAARGTAVHRLAERLVHGEQVTVPGDIRGWVEACARFQDDYDIRPVLVEPAVFSREHGYAGSPDLIAFADPGDGTVTVLADYKTKAGGEWGDTAFQLAGYRFAGFWLDEDGEEQPMPEVDECWSVWLRDGEYDVYPLRADEHVFHQLLYANEARLAGEEYRTYLGEALVPPSKSTLCVVQVGDPA